MTAGRVDAHHHLWDPARRDYPWMDGPRFDPIRRRFTAADLAAATAPHGVTRTVAVQARTDLSETHDLLEVAAADPLVAGVVGWVDLTAPDVGAVLADLRARPDGAALVGIRHLVHDEPDPAWLLRADVRRGLAAVADAGLVYDLLVRPRELGAAARVVAELPQARFVLDHIAKPEIAAGRWEPWASALAALAACPNVSCKVSGLVTEADWDAWKPADLRRYVDHVRATFGDDRLMFGSDWPVCLLAASYRQVVEVAEEAFSDASAETRERVFGGTAREVYGLPA